MKRLLFVIIAMQCLCVNALTIADYSSMKDKQKSNLCFYLTGVREGFIWAELMELNSYQKPTKFCPEKQKITLNCMNYLSLIDGKIKTYKDQGLSNLVSDEMPLEPTYHQVLREAYSCK
jgi:hypothetical protein